MIFFKPLSSACYASPPPPPPPHLRPTYSPPPPPPLPLHLPLAVCSQKSSAWAETNRIRFARVSLFVPLLCIYVQQVCVRVAWVFFFFFFPLRECGGGGGVVVEASSWGKVCFSSSSFFCASRCRVRSVRNLANAPRPEKKMSKLIAT